MNVRAIDTIDAKGAFSTAPAPSRRTLPKYVHADKTRHGKTVYYFRRGKKSPRIRLRERIGSPEFLGEYAEAMAGKTPVIQSFIYFARAGNKVKIGISKNPKQRLGGIRTGNSSKVRIYYVTPGDSRKERDLHRRFAEHRVNGEWFLFAQTIRDWIAKDEAERTTR